MHGVKQPLVSVFDKVDRIGGYGFESSLPDRRGNYRLAGRLTCCSLVEASQYLLEEIVVTLIYSERFRDRRRGPKMNFVKKNELQRPELSNGSIRRILQHRFKIWVCKVTLK